MKKRSESKKQLEAYQIWVKTKFDKGERMKKVFEEIGVSIPTLYNWKRVFKWGTRESRLRKLERKVFEKEIVKIKAEIAVKQLRLRYKSEIYKEHTEIILLLAEVGKSCDFGIWIGKREQFHRSGKLRQYVTLENLGNIKNIQNPNIVSNVDILWVKDNKIVFLFEVEATTGMIESLNRGSNIESVVPKFLVIPAARRFQLEYKMRSPMFSERFRNDNWKILFFETLRNEYRMSENKKGVFNSLIDNRFPGLSWGMKISDMCSM